MLTWIFDKLKTSLLEKWLGRLVVVGLAALSGFLISQGLDATVTATWIQATQDLLIQAIPIIIAWLFGLLRYNIALNKMPPIK